MKGLTIAAIIVLSLFSTLISYSYEDLEPLIEEWNTISDYGSGIYYGSRYNLTENVDEYFGDSIDRTRSLADMTASQHGGDCDFGIELEAYLEDLDNAMAEHNERDVFLLSCAICQLFTNVKAYHEWLAEQWDEH